MLTEILSGIILVLSIFYMWYRYHYNYWKRQNVKFLRALPLSGSCKELFTLKQSFNDQLYTLYKNKTFENEPMFGFFLGPRPALLIKDLDLIKHIMIKQFSSFSSRVLTPDPIHDPICFYNMFFSPTEVWKELRSNLTPIFTNSKLRQMYDLMEVVSDN